MVKDSIIYRLVQDIHTYMFTTQGMIDIWEELQQTQEDEWNDEAIHYRLENILSIMNTDLGDYQLLSSILQVINAVGYEIEQNKKITPIFCCDFMKKCRELDIIWRSNVTKKWYYVPAGFIAETIDTCPECGTKI